MSFFHQYRLAIVRFLKIAFLLKMCVLVFVTYLLISLLTSAEESGQPLADGLHRLAVIMTVGGAMFVAVGLLANIWLKRSLWHCKPYQQILFFMAYLLLFVLPMVYYLFRLIANEF